MAAAYTQTRGTSVLLHTLLTLLEASIRTLNLALKYLSIKFQYNIDLAIIMRLRHPHPTLICRRKHRPYQSLGRCAPLRSSPLPPRCVPFL